MKALFRSLVTLFLFALTSIAAMGQMTQSVVDVVTTRFPIIDVHVAVRQGGALRRDIDSSMFRLFEDGFEQSPLKLTFEDPPRYFSLTMIIPVVSSMSAGDIAAARGIGVRIVNRMNGITDEAAVIDGNPLPAQELTNIQPRLISALDNLQPGGSGITLWGTAYDGVAHGLGATNPDRAILLISNGRGGTGAKNLIDVINLAKNGNIKVHCFGVNAVNNDQEMRQLAQETGGTFYTNIDLLVQEIVDDLTGQPQYGVLEYTSNNACRDGVARELIVRFREGDDSISTNYQMALAADPSTNVSLNLAMDTASITSGTARNVAVKYSPAVQSQRLYPGIMTLAYDTSLLKLNQVVTTGTLSAGMNAVLAQTATGATITLSNAVSLNGSGTLMLLNFTAADVPANTDMQVGISSIQFDRGCISAQPSVSRITVRPKNASLSISTSPVVFTWNSTTGRYTPDPALVTVEVTNTGDIPVTALTARLADSPDIKLAYGAVADVVVLPDSLGPGNKGIAVFYVQAVPQATEKTAQVSVTVNGNPVNKSGIIFFNIKAAESAVVTRARVDEIRIQSGNYVPDRAIFSAAVHAIGTLASPGGTVTLDLPSEVIIGTSETQAFTSMQPNDSTVLVWSLLYPKSGVATTYTIGVITEPTGLMPDTTYVTMFVPELQAEQLEVTCDITPKRLLWSPSTGSYTPVEGEFSVSVENTGTVGATAVRATVVVPPGVSYSPGETPMKTIGDIAPGIKQTVTWKFRFLPIRQCADIDVELKVTVVSQTSSSQCMSSVFVESANSAKPTVLDSTPAQLDTVDRGTAVTFIVDAIDPDHAQLMYAWGVNGVFEPARTDSTYTKTFDTNGQYQVVCRIFDPCALSGEGDTTFVIWNFIVRGSTSAKPAPSEGDFAILGNYPNPFNPGTAIEYVLPAGQHQVRLDVVDATGRVLRTLVDDTRPGGVQRVHFDASGMPSGVYTVRLQSGTAVRTHQLTLVK